ncbi:MAG: hypothetical protein M0031_10770 [Thermaerobacter sp.]|nr:hypothetical protein [Thermaerobacter sp.]
MRQDFGDQVLMEYVDVDDERLGDYPQAKEALQQGRYLPLVLINGAVTFEGGLPWRYLLEELEQMGIRRVG